MGAVAHSFNLNISVTLSGSSGTVRSPKTTTDWRLRCLEICRVLCTSGSVLCRVQVEPVNCLAGGRCGASELSGANVIQSEVHRAAPLRCRHPEDWPIGVTLAAGFGVPCILYLKQQHSTTQQITTAQADPTQHNAALFLSSLTNRDHGHFPLG